LKKTVKEVSRREALGALGAVGAAVVAGCSSSPTASEMPTSTSRVLKSLLLAARRSGGIAQVLVTPTPGAGCGARGLSKGAFSAPC
jgi:hypothetical protein